MDKMEEAKETVQTIYTLIPLSVCDQSSYHDIFSIMHEDPVRVPAEIA